TTSNTRRSRSSSTRARSRSGKNPGRSKETEAACGAEPRRPATRPAVEVGAAGTGEPSAGARAVSRDSEFHLIPPLAEAVRDMGYTRPTPIQAEAVPVILAGRHLIGCASTGTGKTAAFLLPILQRLHGETAHGKLRALILSPTRELALQIDEQALALGYHVGLTAVAVVGGVEMRMQERALRGGAEIVVATPGRLLDHMRFGYVDKTIGAALPRMVLPNFDHGTHAHVPLPVGAGAGRSRRRHR